MKLSKPVNKTRLKLFIFVWFFLCSTMIFYFSSANKAAFDSKLLLSQALMSLEFESQLQTILTRIDNTNSKQDVGQIFHITQGNCYCEWLANAHRKSIDTWANKHKVNVLNVKLQDFPLLSEFIPSTPAIVVTNQHDELVYLGPYSRGSGCFSASGQVDEYLKQWRQTQGEGKDNTSAIIETEASGCYCAT